MSFRDSALRLENLNGELLSLNDALLSFNDALQNLIVEVL
jgi:hypothetical protein